MLLPVFALLRRADAVGVIGAALVARAAGVGARRAAAVDSYWPHHHRVVVEYREIQHDRPVPHFDKPDRLTVSGVHRGIQRLRYDQRRDEQIPAHGLRLVVIKPADLASDRRGRLLRNRDHDLQALRAKLADQAK